MTRDRILALLAALATVLTAIRFFLPASLAAVTLSADELAAANAFSSAYEVVLPFVLLAALALLTFRFRTTAWSGWPLLLGPPVLALVAGLVDISGPRSAPMASLFPPLTVVAVASASLLSLAFAPPLRRLTSRWWGVAYLGLLVLVPLVFGLRVAVSLGAGTRPDPSGVLRGDWTLVKGPTLLPELYAIGVWIMLVSGLHPSDVVRRWRALLPFAAWPPVAALFVVRPLAGFILSAVISWGANLELFVPVWASLNLALASVACYVSTLIIVRGPLGSRWTLFACGTACIVLAGYFPTMVSAIGLTFALLLVAVALPREAE